MNKSIQLVQIQDNKKKNKERNKKATSAVAKTGFAKV